jgi:hypothetical protein
MENGKLLDAIEAAFDLFLTHDRGFENQQNWTRRELACVIVSLKSMKRLLLPEKIERLAVEIESAPPGKVTVVEL